MYSLKCSYYQKEFITIDELIDDVMLSGMDPNYEITFNGQATGEQVSDLLTF
jgi:hypothetical protein